MPFLLPRVTRSKMLAICLFSLYASCLCSKRSLRKPRKQLIYSSISLRSINKFQGDQNSRSDIGPGCNTNLLRLVIYLRFTLLHCLLLREHIILLTISTLPHSMLGSGKEITKKLLRFDLLDLKIFLSSI
jgi:hypothetical protein